MAEPIIIGKTYQSKSYGEFKVVSKEAKSKHTIEFPNGYRKVAKDDHIRHGRIKNPYYPNISGVGFIGVGDYNARTMNEKPYRAWSKMLDRCYNTNYRCYERYGGRGITVCEGWHNYQIFAEWYFINYIDGYELDKDLKNPGSMQYNPENCVFVPHQINSLLVSNNAVRGKYPVGIHYHKAAKKFRAQCHCGRDQVIIGDFDSPVMAFMEYAAFKENRIKTLSQEYFDKGLICKEVYETLQSWSVEPFPE